jgi:hypothetical protein
MTGVKGFALVLVGILVFSASCFYASEVYSRPSAQETTGLEAEAWGLMQELRDSEHLVTDLEGIGMFDPAKVATADGKLLQTEHNTDLEFQLEIICDDHPTWSRSIANGDPIQTSAPPSVVEEGDMATVHSAATIYNGPDDVKPARLVLRVWEA